MDSVVLSERESSVEIRFKNWILFGLDGVHDGLIELRRGTDRAHFGTFLSRTTVRKHANGNAPLVKADT